IPFFSIAASSFSTKLPLLKDEHTLITHGSIKILSYKYISSAVNADNACTRCELQSTAYMK
ncbi:hypothetical protein, partial [Lysinibacillus agricola]|uniref:hypothetical protein n=1 Tax=Lysinibacillus agricola TaxID=2590012 RepID=UPI003C2C847C